VAEPGNATDSRSVGPHDYSGVLNLAPFFLFFMGVQARIGKPVARKGLIMVGS
jgi:hypothetical protein